MRSGSASLRWIGIVVMLAALALGLAAGGLFRVVSARASGAILSDVTFSYDESDTTHATVVFAATYTGSSALQTLTLSLANGAYTASDVLTSGTGHADDCSAANQRGVAVGCSFATPLAPGTRFAITFKVSPPYPEGETNSYSAVDASGTDNETFTGPNQPTTGTTTTSTSTTGTTTTTSTTSTTTTGTTTYVPVGSAPLCKISLSVREALHAGPAGDVREGRDGEYQTYVGAKLKFSISIRNEGDCATVGLTLSDRLPSAFNRHKPREPIAPGGRALIYLTGEFHRVGEIKNVVYVSAENARRAKSNEVRVKVVFRDEFRRTIRSR
jgi:hypothetical protein